MFRFEGAAARRLRRKAALRTRWEIALLTLVVGHWAYHKNREWDLLVKDLVAARGRQFDLDALDDEGPPTTALSHSIDLTSTEDALDSPAAR